MELREYQQRVLSQLWNAMQRQLHCLLVAPCSAGKTIIFASLIQRLLAEHPGFRALILVDREILAQQAADKLKLVAPELGCGIVCAGISPEKILDKPVTVASRQTLEKQLGKFPRVQLCICDEAHMLPIPHPKKREGQYERIIRRLKGYNQNMRLIGATATPYRLGAFGGYIYGKRNRAGSLPYFGEITAEISTAELLASHHITGLKGMERVQESLRHDLNGLRLQDGEFNLQQLASLMCRESHVHSVVEGWQLFCRDRKKTIVFCTTVHHAEEVVQAFHEVGVRALPIHASLSPLELASNQQELLQSTAPVFVSVAMLTTGLDVADVDCLILARPTKSAALYKQILGRGQRLAEGKTDCLVLDLVGAFQEFGTDLDNIEATWPKGDGRNSASEPGQKRCQKCGAECHASLRYCPECGEEFKREGETAEAELGEMQEVAFAQPEPVEHLVHSVSYADHCSKKSQKHLIRVWYHDEYGMPIASEYICLPDYYEGYAVTRARNWWAARSDEPFPETVDEFLFLAESVLPCPMAVTTIKDGKYDRVASCRFAQEEAGELALETGQFHDQFNPELGF